MTTTAKKAKARKLAKLALTSRAKMGAARKAKKAAAATDLKEQLAASVETVAERVEPVIVATGLDGDAGPGMETIGEPVAPAAKARAPSIRATVKEARAENEAAHVARMDACTQAAEAARTDLAALDFDTLKGITVEQALHYAQLLATSGGITPRAVEDATRLTLRQRCRVDALLGRAGYKLRHKRNPDRVPGDRFTSSLFWIEKAA
jgi:hypothetical protein